MFSPRFYSVILLLCFATTALEAETVKPKSPLPGSWFGNNANVVWGDKTRYTPTKTSHLYLEYELMGRQGPFDFYGYVDFPKFFGVGTKDMNGFWDKEGAKAFADFQGRMSFNHIFKWGTTPGLLKEFFFATNYVGNYGDRKYGASSHVLWLGLGTTVNTYSKLGLNINFYARKNFSHYGGIHEYDWKGYRLKVNWSHPIATIMKGKGSLAYRGFADYDFGLGNEPKDKPSESLGSNNSFVVSNVLTFSYKRFNCSGVLRYWHHGGEMKNNGGTFQPQTNGFGYYIIAGFSLN